MSKVDLLGVMGGADYCITLDIDISISDEEVAQRVKALCDLLSDLGSTPRTKTNGASAGKQSSQPAQEYAPKGSDGKTTITRLIAKCPSCDMPSVVLIEGIRKTDGKPFKKFACDDCGYKSFGTLMSGMTKQYS